MEYQGQTRQWSLLLLVFFLFVNKANSQASWGRNVADNGRPRYPTEYRKEADATGYPRKEDRDLTEWARAKDDRFYTERPPPPPPPPPQQNGPLDKRGPSSYNPIHYNFQSRNQREEAIADSRDRTRGEVQADGEEVPQTFSSVEDNIGDHAEEREMPRFASPRQDAVTRYMATSRGRATLWLSSGVVGAALGAFVGTSLLNRPLLTSVMGAMVFLFYFTLRNPYGELVRALGLTLVWAVERSRRVRQDYPTLGHVKAMVGAGPRRPFPPKNDPWNYQPDDNEIAFNMLYSIIAMAFVGSACGGNLPLIPTWMGALAGAAALAFATTLPNARGDLSRSMGMRVVALGGQAMDINRELQLLRKVAVVSGLILDKLLILDRKHRIKDRLVRQANFLYDQISRTVSQAQNQSQERRRRERDDDDDWRRRSPRDEREEEYRTRLDEQDYYRRDREDHRGERDYRRDREDRRGERDRNSYSTAWRK